MCLSNQAHSASSSLSWKWPLKAAVTHAGFQVLLSPLGHRFETQMRDLVECLWVSFITGSPCFSPCRAPAGQRGSSRRALLGLCSSGGMGETLQSCLLLAGAPRSWWEHSGATGAGYEVSLRTSAFFRSSGSSRSEPGRAVPTHRELCGRLRAVVERAWAPSFQLSVWCTSSPVVKCSDKK